MIIRKLGGVLGAATFALGPAMAQEAVPSSRAEVFEPSYFARFNPTNAEDMVRQVPGFSIDEGDSVRGFAGAAGNVLINGEQPSTKTDLRTVLGRIPVARVLRIEIVSAATGELDMRGQTKIANVILRASNTDRATAWETTLRYFQGERLTASAEASITQPMFGGTLTLSAEGGQDMSGGPGGGTRAFGTRDYFNGAGVQFEHHDGLILNQSLSIAPSFDFRRPFDRGTLRLNGNYSNSEFTGGRLYTVLSPGVGGNPIRFEPQVNESAQQRFDVGGDIERSLNDDASAKLIFFHKRQENSGDNLFSFYNGAGAFTRSTLLRNDDTSGESILRGQVNWKLSDAHAIEVSLEGAYNFLDSARTVTLNSGLNVTPPGSDTIVEELRAEAQISDVWTVTPKLTLEPGFKFEVSRIEQEARLTGGASLFAEREFSYPKPSLSLAWTPNDDQQLRLSLQRDVAQLNFGDFVSAVEVTNDRIVGGNADLKPAQAWAFLAEFEQKFWADGVVTLIGSFDQVEDVQDVVPVVPLGGTISSAFDGPGNLGEGERWSLGFEASIPLDRLGLDNAKLDLALNSGSSEVVDPVTGLSREFSDYFTRQWNVDFRQDLPSWGFSYGFRFSESGGGTTYRLKELFKRQRSGGDFSVFVETKRFFGLNIRAGFSDIFDPYFFATRVVFDGPRSTGAPILIQNSESHNGEFGFIRLSGTF
ncbi:MAG: outer membrane beta-barrel protein [Alphaproteobacteria bacterium]|nr:outer membrane beta-barrel protein [Alphaproteobacteria bacterium]